MLPASSYITGPPGRHLHRDLNALVDEVAFRDVVQGLRGLLRVEDDHVGARAVPPGALLLPPRLDRPRPARAHDLAGLVFEEEDLPELAFTQKVRDHILVEFLLA